MISTAPLYTGRRVRTHTTDIGRILCTGIGCIGCNAKRLGNKSIGEVLGDIDTVDFGAKREEFRDIRQGSVLINRSIAAPSCYGNDDSYFGAKVEYAGKIGRRVQQMEENKNKNHGNVDADQVENSVRNGRRIEDNVQCKSKDVQINDSPRRKSGTEGTNRGRTLSHSLSIHRRKNATRLPTRKDERLIDLKRPRSTNLGKPNKQRVVIKHSYANKSQTNLLDMPMNTKGRIEGSQTQVQKGNVSKSKMSFLEMLQKSEAGIYDVEAMEDRKTSWWVSQILEAGISEKELLPRVPSAKRAAVIAKDTRAKHGNNMVCVEVSNLPKITLNDRFLYESEDTVVVIEHEDEGTTKTDASLHQLYFAVECSSVRRSLPRYSILDIAEGLGELVSTDSVQVIQRKGRKWNVLIKGNGVKDFLTQHGVVVKGRRLRMIETAAII